MTLKDILKQVRDTPLPKTVDLILLAEYIFQDLCYSYNTNKTRLNAGRLSEKANIKYSTLTKIKGGVVTKPSVQTIQKSPSRWAFLWKNY